MNEYYFEYRDGEITTIIKANTYEEAIKKFEKKDNLKFDIEFNMLW